MRRAGPQHSGLSVPEQFAGVIVHQTASTPSGTDEVTRVNGEAPFSEAEVLIGPLADNVDSVAVDTSIHFGFDADGLTGDHVG